MRYLLLLSFVILSTSFVKQNAPGPDAPVLAFDAPVFDFGRIPEGEEVRHEFRFTNKGKSPLIIQSVMTGCGCDMAEWPQEPIPPGKTGMIHYIFDTSSKAGSDIRTITVVSNAVKSPLILTVTSEIIPRRGVPLSPDQGAPQSSGQWKRAH